jgi:hypothetical protein
VSQVLNYYRNTTDQRIYRQIYLVIKQIYEHCLGFRPNPNGFFAVEEAGGDQEEETRPSAYEQSELRPIQQPGCSRMGTSSASFLLSENFRPP